MADHQISSKFSKLNPFNSDDDDKGGAISVNSVGGGGRSTRKAQHEKQQLNVSDALRKYLVEHNVIAEHDAGVGSSETTPALRSLLGKSHFNVPESLLDRSRPLPEYFISSSHNTYLMAHQLYGSSSASAYETALKTGSRCVEIDAWDNSANPEEPKVTHGFTLVSHVLFRDVCETIRDVFDEEKSIAHKDPGCRLAPILLSLENHCGEQGQKRLVDIMKEVLGDRLLAQPVIQKGHREQSGADEHVCLADLGACIAVIVEYDLKGVDGAAAQESDSESSSANEQEGEEAEAARKAYKQKMKEAPPAGIIPELADLGVYAQSVKPVDNSWFNPGTLVNGPHHHLINLSESGLSSHLPGESIAIAAHNSQHLMRVYPKGTRISSSNLKPLQFWAIGAQICALNWQTFGTSNQLNDALFSGSEGYILKPAALRSGGDGKILTGRRKRLRLHVAGATDIPVHDDREPDSLKPYLTCNLYSPGDVEGETHKRKTAPYKHHKLGMLRRGDDSAVTDPIWDETLEWVYEDNELVFLRMLIKSDDAWARNPMIAVAAIRLLYAVPGWTFIRMMDMKGGETKCTILMKMEMDNV
ncbi:1-phosphatidylinositol-4,5-bisphosphate phosphodiesterase gamma 2 [Metarhizium album ARSEF 1941]|uniref:Phosphoinositide phospholipase C n=1 Tax=Metarhizium album (strain ARSEF 1941) TaxID=1081103 RepID=A0A0B2WYN1_METAS|nr:1-phosphatidylinositol-4,5-bisphosphate phosphodiesterase gamma 2 [Metarhizium album ARSEF 1941]KHN97960.1 1-phosphatidylinositol-4,5-bisphosphate phosphodiesterase gamma 2 [Metarhizium album ARSEF 1941]